MVTPIIGSDDSTGECGIASVAASSSPTSKGLFLRVSALFKFVYLLWTDFVVDHEAQELGYRAGDDGLAACPAWGLLAGHPEEGAGLDLRQSKQFDGLAIGGLGHGLLGGHVSGLLITYMVMVGP